MTFAKHTLAYLATPFTKYPLGTDAAIIDAIRVAGNLLAAGITVYSPIAYCSVLARQHGFDMMELDLWLPIEERMCRACDVLIVAQLDGWDASDGIAREVKRFERWGRRIYDLTPATLDIKRREPVAA